MIAFLGSTREENILMVSTGFFLEIDFSHEQTFKTWVSAVTIRFKAKF